MKKKKLKKKYKQAREAARYWCRSHGKLLSQMKEERQEYFMRGVISSIMPPAFPFFPALGRSFRPSDDRTLEADTLEPKESDDDKAV